MSSSVSLVNPTTEIGKLTGFPCKSYNRNRWIHRFPLCSTIPRSALGDGPFAPKNPPDTIPAPYGSRQASFLEACERSRHEGRRSRAPKARRAVRIPALGDSEGHNAATRQKTQQWSPQLRIVGQIVCCSVRVGSN